MSLHTISVIELARSRKQLQAKGKPEVKQPILLVSTVSAAILGWIAVARAQGWPTDLQKTYADITHCLVSPEIRSDKDNPISCYCRDAIADARYVYFTYMLPGKDPNMAGIVLALQRDAGEICSPDTAEPLKPDFAGKIHTATMEKDWKWDGPEVVRTYPPDDVIRQIKPDKQGWISVEYTTVLLWRDSQGRVTKTESFSALERGPAEHMLSKPPSQEGPARKAPPKH